MYAVIYRDDTNNDSTCIGIFNKKTNAKKCLIKKYNEVCDLCKNQGIEISDFNLGEFWWDITYNEAYCDTCDIQKIENPAD